MTAEPIPPDGVHWLAIEFEGDDDWHPHVVHPADCPTEDIPTGGVCEAHLLTGSPQRTVVDEVGDKDGKMVWSRMAGYCDDCATAGPPYSQHTCAFTYEFDMAGNDCLATDPDWKPEDDAYYRIEHVVEVFNTPAAREVDTWVTVHEKVE